MNGTNEYKSISINFDKSSLSSSFSIFGIYQPVIMSLFALIENSHTLLSWQLFKLNHLVNLGAGSKIYVSKTVIQLLPVCILNYLIIILG